MSFQENTNAPKLKPVIKADFQNGKGLGGDWYFSRLSTATYTDENGYVCQAEINEPRFEHNPNPYTQSGYPCKGLLIEADCNNSLQGTVINSSGIGAPWEAGDSAAVFGNQNNAYPPSTLDANVCFIATSGGNGATARDLGGGASPSGTNAVWSVFVKKDPNNTSSVFRLNMQNFSTWQQGGGAGAIFTLSGEGNVNPDYIGGEGNVGIQAYPNGWYRCFIVATLNQSAGVRGRLVLTNQDSTSKNQDLSLPQNQLEGIYVWAPQLEVYPPSANILPAYNRFMIQPASVILTESGVQQTTKARDICGLFGSAVTDSIDPFNFTFIVSARDTSINASEQNFPRMVVVRNSPTPYSDFSAYQNDCHQIFQNWAVGATSNTLYANTFRNNVGVTTGLGRNTFYYQQGYNNNRMTVAYALEFSSEAGTIPTSPAGNSYCYTTAVGQKNTTEMVAPAGPLNQIYLGAAGNSRYIQGCYEFFEVYNQQFTTDEIESIVEYKHVEQNLL